MPDLFPLQLLLATLAGWVNRHQAQVIEYLVEVNRVLEEQLGKKRLRLTDDQRRRLAAKGKIIGGRLRARIATIVTPDTILRWHRQAARNVDWTRSVDRSPSKRVARMATAMSSSATAFRQSASFSESPPSRYRRNLCSGL